MLALASLLSLSAGNEKVSLLPALSPNVAVVVVTVTPCWLGHHCPPLTDSSGCWMWQLVFSVVLESSTVAWSSYFTLSCSGWTFLYKLGVTVHRCLVFKAGRPSTLSTAAHLLRMSPAVSVFTLSVSTSSSFHDIVAASSVVGHFLLSAWWPGTLCLRISTTQRLAMTSLEQQWRSTFLQVSEHLAH